MGPKLKQGRGTGQIKVGFSVSLPQFLIGGSMVFGAQG